jgi:glucose/arabinose dehydrogenase
MNERDNLGDDLVPDYATSLKDGGFYGWPYSYIGQHYDPRYVGALPDLVKRATVPDVLIPSHSAPLGLAFYTGTQFPQRYRNGVFVALHGSWNRSRPTGYKVIRVQIGRQGEAQIKEDFVTGFIKPGETHKGEWMGRPVDVIVGPEGAVYISDDAAGVIYRVSPK